MLETRELTVREMVKAIQVEMRDTDLQPDRAAYLQNRVVSLLGNISDELREADLAYKRILLAALYANKAANRARIEAETSPEFVRRQEASDTQKQAIEMIRTLRHFLRVKSEELRYT